MWKNLLRLPWDAKIRYSAFIFCLMALYLYGHGMDIFDFQQFERDSPTTNFLDDVFTVVSFFKNNVHPMETLTSHGRHLREHNVDKHEEKYSVEKAHQAHLALFSVADPIRVLGPTAFPKPTYIFQTSQHLATSSSISQLNQDEVVPYLKPISGIHRPEQDAVLLFAAEYPLLNYLLFVSTLRDTGYIGDIVMAISSMDWNKTEIRDYLQSDLFVIVYIVDYECYNAEGISVDSSKGGIRVCHCHNLYGRKQQHHQPNSVDSKTASTILPLRDPRHARTVQNSRYELYWIWSTHYDPHSWIMLIDARDSVFQRNPFDLVPRQNNNQDDNTAHEDSGILIFFGENVEATRLGKSKFNRDWLDKAYGQEIVQALADKPTICSGTTMGEQIAIETYLRAMVSESDETKTVKMGADQGFHNYLYYSNKLNNANTIQKILIQDQGYGIINNLGALRTKSLEEWGNGKVVETIYGKDSKADVSSGNKIQAINVLNWDESLSPVVHQFDRHKELMNWWFKRKGREFEKRWADVKKARVKKE